MTNNRHIKYAQLKAILQNHKREAERSNNARLKLVYNYGTDKSKTEYSYSIRQVNPVGLAFPIVIYLGMKTISQTISDGYVTDDSAVRTIWHINHEIKHVYDHLSLYHNQDVSEDVKAIAETEIVGDYIPEYRRKAYRYLPAEYSAELYALSNTSDFFERNFPDIDYQDCILKWVNSKDYPFFYGPIDSYDEIESKLYKQYQKNMFAKRFGMIYIGEAIESKSAKRITKDTEFLKKLYLSDDGKSETKCLVNYIAKHSPHLFANYKCIQSSYVTDGIVKASIATLMKSKIERDLPSIDYPEDEEPQDEKQ